MILPARSGLPETNTSVVVNLGDGKVEEIWACDVIKLDREREQYHDILGTEESDNQTIPVSEYINVNCHTVTTVGEAQVDYFLVFKALLQLGMHSESDGLEKLARNTIIRSLLSQVQKLLSSVTGDSKPASPSRDSATKSDLSVTDWEKRVFSNPEKLKQDIMKKVLPGGRGGLPYGATGSIGGLMVVPDQHSDTEEGLILDPSEITVNDFTHEVQIQAVLLEVLEILSVVGDSALEEVGLDLSGVMHMTLAELLSIRDGLRDYLQRLETNGTLFDLANTTTAVLFRQVILMIIADLRELQHVQQLLASGEILVSSRPQSLAGQIVDRLTSLGAKAKERTLRRVLASQVVQRVEDIKPQLDEQVRVIREQMKSAEFQSMTREQRIRFIRRKIKSVKAALKEVDTGTYWGRQLELILNDRLSVLLADLNSEHQWHEEPSDMDGGKGKDKGKVTFGENSKASGSSHNSDRSSEERETSEEPDQEDEDDRNDPPEEEGDREELTDGGAPGFQVRDRNLSAFLANLFSSYYRQGSNSQAFAHQLSQLLTVSIAPEKLDALVRVLIRKLKDNAAYQRTNFSPTTIQAVLEVALWYGRYTMVVSSIMEVFNNSDVLALQQNALQAGLELPPAEEPLYERLMHRNFKAQIENLSSYSSDSFSE